MLAYLIFVRPVEEFFAEQLGWDEGQRARLKAHLFYARMGRDPKESEHLSAALKHVTNESLGVELGVHDWRHFCAALGRVLLMFEMDHNEESDSSHTNMMDAQAGRTQSTSDLIYGLLNNQLGHLNPRIWAKFAALTRLWHSQVFKLPVAGRVADLDEILSPNVQLESNGQGKGESKPQPLVLEDAQKLMSIVVETQRQGTAALAEKVQHLDAKVDGLIQQMNDMKSFFQSSLTSLQTAVMERLPPVS